MIDHDHRSPADTMHASDAREIIETVAGDLREEIRLMLDISTISAEYRAALHAPLDRAESQSAAAGNATSSPPNA